MQLSLTSCSGGLLQTDTDSLKRMVLGDLLELGLQKHADEVKAIVQRAVKGLFSLTCDKSRNGAGYM